MMTTRKVKASMWVSYGLIILSLSFTGGTLYNQSDSNCRGLNRAIRADRSAWSYILDRITASWKVNPPSAEMKKDTLDTFDGIFHLLRPVDC